MDDGSRTSVQLKLDRKLLEKAQAAGLDVSALVEEALREGLRASLRTALTDEERTAVREGIDWHDAFIAEHGSFADRWRRF